MRKKTIEAIRAHAIAAYPRECCGLVVRVGRAERYLACDNQADSGGHFMIGGDDYAAAEEMGAVIAVVHSHPDEAAEPSEADRVTCETSGVPWVILEVRGDGEGQAVTGEIRSIVPVGYRAPLVGRPFFHGVLDCYAVIRDWYSRERDIQLPDFEREDGWWNGDRELYLENFAAAGFHKLAAGEVIQTGDVVLMQHMSKRINHGGLYLGAARLKTEVCDTHFMSDAMLHHLYGRPSEIVVYGGQWLEATHAVLRYSAAIAT
ncbi:tail assembly protein K [Bordetella phage vB_BbrS_PHB09]|nr:tail assembly protein K [Bordetella phage vB_BbrS_PHB09]